MEFCSVYCTNTMKMDSLQRWILIHSIIYYEMDRSLVTDKVFDDNCRQLVGLIESDPESHKKTDLYYVFNDFDGSTGFDLYHRLNRVDKRRYKNEAINAVRVCRR